MNQFKTGAGVSEAVRGIHHVALNVGDLKRSVDFYERFMGLRVIDSDDHFAKLTLGEAEIALFKIPSDAPIARENGGVSQASLNHIAIEIHPSVFDQFHKRLLNNGVTITFGPVKRRHGQAVYFLDPDGHKIELFYNKSH